MGERKKEKLFFVRTKIICFFLSFPTEILDLNRNTIFFFKEPFKIVFLFHEKNLTKQQKEGYFFWSLVQSFRKSSGIQVIFFIGLYLIWPNLPWLRFCSDFTSFWLKYWRGYHLFLVNLLFGFWLETFENE